VLQNPQMRKGSSHKKHKKHKILMPFVPLVAGPVLSIPEAKAKAA